MRMMFALSVLILAASCSGPNDRARGPGGRGSMQAQNTSDSGPQRRMPPEEAFTVCEDKGENDACTVETPRGTLEGTCIAFENEALVCAPANRPPRR